MNELIYRVMIGEFRFRIPLQVIGVFISTAKEVFLAATDRSNISTGGQTHDALYVRERL